MRIYGVRSVVGTHESAMINRRSISRFLALMISGALALKASANGFRLPDQDAFATARGEAFVATADNPSAIYYNPAGITQLEGNNLRGGLYGIYLDSSFSPPAAPPTTAILITTRTISPRFPRFSTPTLPTNSPVSFGLGVYAPYGGKSSWPQNTGFRAVAMDGSLTYLTINPVVAVKLPFNFHRWRGDGELCEHEYGTRPESIPNCLRTPTSSALPATVGAWVTIWGCSGNRMRRFRLAPRSAVRRRSPWMARRNTSNSPIISATNQSAQTDFKFPLTVVIGISYRPTPKWNIEFDADYTDWSSFGSNTIHQAIHHVIRVNQDIPLKLNWQPSWMYEFGVTRYFDNGWHASAGFVYNENSVPNKYYTPMVADMDRYFFSAGAGYKGKHFNFDIAYQFGYGPTHTVTGSQPSSTSPAVQPARPPTANMISSAMRCWCRWAGVFNPVWRFGIDTAQKPHN